MIIYLIAGLVVGGVIGAVLRSKSSGAKMANAEREAAQIVESAKKEADTIRKEADIQSKDVVFKGLPGKMKSGTRVKISSHRKKGWCRKRRILIVRFPRLRLETRI
jgi:hypothetical protein